jgi:hypothetical protein
VDSSAVKKVEGARVIEDRDLVAVLHKNPDEAEKALSQIKAKFDMPEATVTDSSIFKHLLNIAPGGNIAAQGGKLQTGEQRATAIFQQTYFDGYVAHAAMETHTALAKIEGNRATVWASTQTPFGAKNEVASALGFPSDNVRIITPFVGGGFGGKTRNQQVVEAARLARLTGTPTQVMWSREDEARSIFTIFLITAPSFMDLVGEASKVLILLGPVPGARRRTIRTRLPENHKSMLWQRRRELIRCHSAWSIYTTAKCAGYSKWLQINLAGRRENRPAAEDMALPVELMQERMWQQWLKSRWINIAARFK